MRNSTTNTEIPEGFTMTELGFFPVDWEVKRLGDHIDECKERNSENNKITVYTVSNIYGFVSSDEFFDKKVYGRNLKTYKIVDYEDFAYNPYRINVGSLGLFKKKSKGLVSPAYIVFKIRNSQKLDSDFLFKLLKSDKYINEVRRISMSRGSVRRSLAFKDLAEFKIPLPPLPEQRKIAAVLSAVEEIREKTEAVIEAARKLKKSLMKHLFTYGPVSSGEAENVLLKETEIGLIPEGWGVVRLGNKGKFQYGYTTSAREENTGTRFLRITDIKEDGVIDWNTVPYGVIDSENLNKFRLSEGDILFARIGATTGKTCIIEGAVPNAIFASYLIRFVGYEELYARYVFYYTQTRRYQELVNAAKEGKLKKGLNATELKSFRLPLPSFGEQRKIADIFSALDRKIMAEEYKKKGFQQLFQTLLHNLMTARIRVTELGVAL